MSGDVDARLRAALARTDPEKLRQLVRSHREIKQIKENLGPQTKEELWQAFKDKYGMELVRESVCPGHCSQLDFVWVVYQMISVLGVFSRGYGKTSLMGLTDALQCDYYPGFNSFTIGPGKDQGERKYEHILPFVVEGGAIGGKELDHIQRSIQTRTEWKNGSKMEIALGGGIDNANGPRSVRLHRDEIELMLAATRKQAANIPAGKQTRDGRYVPGHTVDTSTMKWAEGYVDKEMQAYYKTLRDAGVDPTTMDPIEAFDLAVSRGYRPRKLMLVSCIYEIAAENPTCRSVPDHERRTRLVELGRDPEEICDCHTFQSDYWDTEDPEEPARSRTLEDVCQGRFFRSRGYQKFEEIQGAFQENDRQTWEAEKECSEPSREGSYIKSYSQDRHGLRDYEPDPENGLIYTTTDWGADDEHYHAWIQVLDRPVQANSYKGRKIKTLPAGSVIIFGEIFRAQIGNVELGKMVLAREREWFLRWPGWVVFERYYDSANRGAMLDWRDQLGIDLVNRIRKDFGEELKMVRTLVGGWTFYVDIPACPSMDASLRGWRQVNGREVRNEHTHAAAGLRYFAHNRHVVERALARAGSSETARPAAAEDEEVRAREREAEVTRGVRVTHHGPPRARTRETIGVAGAADSPIREGSTRIDGPSPREERIR